MIKRASTILLTLFLLLLGFNTAFAAPSCSTTFSKTNLKPRTSSSTFYDLEDVAFSEGIPTDINCPLDYVENANPGRGKYTVSGNKLSIGCVKNGNLLAISIPNLKSGQTYSISITASVRLRAKESDASEKHRTKFKLAAGSSDKYFENSGSDWSATGACNMSLEFTPSSDYVTATISTDYSGDCYILDITEIKIIGCFDPTITSANGTEICKGEENTYTAIGINGPLKWEYSTDNKSTWKKLTDETGNSVTADLQEEFFYVKASNGTNYVESDKIQTFICCSKTSEKKDKHIIVYEEYFNLTNGQRRPLDNNARSQYDYSSSGKIGGNESTSGKEAEYAIVHKASDGGYWKSEPVRQGNTVEKPGESDSNDGFLLVNCGKEKQDFFYYLVQQGNLCSQSLYDFSVDITNVDNTAGQAPVNAIILVHGQKNGTLSSQPLLKIETGNLESGHDWETFTRSFNSDQYNEFRISVRNNYQGTETDVKGNDIGIDNIVFRTCAPEIQIYSPKEDGSLEYEEVLLECDRKITLEAIATYDLTEFFSTPQYLFQISTDKVNWTNVGSVQTTPSVEITVDDTYLNGFYYQVWVGADAAEVLKSGRTQTQGTGCGALTAVSDPISVKYECTNSSRPPTLKDFSSCALEDGKYDLYNTITKINLSDGTSEDVSNLDLAAKKAKIATLGEIEWYKEGETTPIPSVIDFPTSPDNPGKYYAKFKQLDTSTIYTQSSSSDIVTISLLKTIHLAIDDQHQYIGCISQFENHHSYYVTELDPVAEQGDKYTYTWMSVNQDGSLNETDPLQIGEENFYVLPLTPGKGKIVVKVVSENGAACPGISDPVEYDLADNPKFELDGVSVPCFDKLKDDGVVVSLKELSGSTMLKIKRKATDENNKVSTTVFTSFEEAGSFKVINYNEEAEFAFKDTYFDAQYFSADFDATKIASVQYDIVLGIETTDCKDEISTETFDISSTNNFSLRPSDNVKDINDDKNIAEYHICEGEQVIVTSTYNEQDGGLKPGEIYEWYVKKGNGEFILDTTDPSLKDSQSYTIPEIDETTTIKVVLVADPNFAGAETCGGEAIITIIVDKEPEVTAENIELCADDKSKKMKVTAKGTYSYEWTPNTGLSNAAIQNPGIISLTTSTDYSLKVTSGTCTITIPEIKVTVNPLPEIGNITVDTDEEGKNVLNVEINGTDTYKYSLDDITYSESTPTNLPIGWNKLYVSDSKGCKSSKLFEVEPTPIYPEKYFTPNGDGVNETWDIENINMYPAYIVEIFDRYGKRLFVQRVGSFSSTGKSDVTGDEFKGWDGIYNGHPMPSDDYWYLITVEEIRKQYTGHFTLKR